MTRAAKKVVRLPAVKHSGYAVGVTKEHYDFITAAAAALGTSRQRLLTGILHKLVIRSTLGTRTAKASRRGARA